MEAGVSVVTIPGSAVSIGNPILALGMDRLGPATDEDIFTKKQTVSA